MSGTTWAMSAPTLEEFSAIGEQVVQDAGEVAACRVKPFGTAGSLGALCSGAKCTEVEEPRPPSGQRRHDRCQVALARQVGVQPRLPSAKGTSDFQKTLGLIEGGQDPTLTAFVFLPVALPEGADYLISVLIARLAGVKPHPGHGLQAGIWPAPEYLAEH
jgi:hypothetical protein